MHIAMTILLGVLVWTLGCGASKEKKLVPNGGLSESEATMLKTINQSREEANQAPWQAWYQGVQPAADQGKVQKMAQMLKDANCSHNMQNLPRQFPFQGMRTSSVGSTGCPIDMMERWSYDSGNLEINGTYSATSDAYLNFSGVGRSTYSGRMRRTGSTFGSRVAGEFGYSNVEIKDVGSISTEVRTEAAYQADGGGAAGQGGGTVSLKMNGPEWGFEASIQWQTKNGSVDYMIGKNYVDAKTFRELFSSYRLDEIMEVSKQMR